MPQLALQHTCPCAHVALPQVTRVPASLGASPLEKGPIVRPDLLVDRPYSTKNVAPLTHSVVECPKLAERIFSLTSIFSQPSPLGGVSVSRASTCAGVIARYALTAASAEGEAASTKRSIKSMPEGLHAAGETRSLFLNSQLDLLVVGRKPGSDERDVHQPARAIVDHRLL